MWEIPLAWSLLGVSLLVYKCASQVVFQPPFLLGGWKNEVFSHCLGKQAGSPDLFLIQRKDIKIFCCFFFTTMVTF